MTQQAQLSLNERNVLQVIARGHPDPDRLMEISSRLYSEVINTYALEWEEIRIAVGQTFDEFCECIAHLVSFKFIKSVRREPSFFGSLFGKKSKVYFWVTSEGEKFLNEILNDNSSDIMLSLNGEDTYDKDGIIWNDKYQILAKKIISEDNQNQNNILEHARISLEKGYTPEETVMESYLFDITLQVNKPKNIDIHKGIEIHTSIFPILGLFKQWKEEGKISPIYWKDTTSAIYHVSRPSEQQENWIETILQALYFLASTKRDKKELEM
jgi:hypothetical protein